MKNKNTTKEKTRLVVLGTFEVKSTTLLATDPCYDIPTWCTTTIENMLPGKYLAKAIISNEGSWGERTKELIIVHESKVDNKLSSGWKWEGDCGVDSGQLGFFEKDLYPKGESTGEMDDKESFYGQCCTITLNDENDGCGVLPYGAVTSSGYGDGNYPCYIAKTKQGVYAVRVKFF